MLWIGLWSCKSVALYILVQSCPNLLRAIAAAGGSLSFVDGYRRPFNLADPAIAFPSRSNIVSFTVVALVALLAPALIILAICFIAPPGHGLKASTGHALRSRLWAINAGLIGLCLSLATALFVTEGLKTIVGKPRPDMLSVCRPDLNNMSAYIVGGVGQTLDSEAPALVSSDICQQKDQSKLRDAFSSFPSGHSSFSWAGLLYLSLWLMSRFSISWMCNYCSHISRSIPGPKKSAPPLWQVLILAMPVGTALFICSSRYADFHHAGIDIFAGTVIGILSAILSFFLYHQSLCYQGRMAFGPRRAQNAFTGNFPWRHADTEPESHDLEARQSCETHD
jgi:membrane-associated phospholipid phosphatase